MADAVAPGTIRNPFPVPFRLPSFTDYDAIAGIQQNFESYQNTGRRPSDYGAGELKNGPRPVFHTVTKKFATHKRPEVLSPQHEELIRFISDSWIKVCKEYESDNFVDSSSLYPGSSTTSVIYYEDREPNKFLQDFKPFDLEAWWGKRLFNNITNSVP